MVSAESNECSRHISVINLRIRSEKVSKISYLSPRKVENKFRSNDIFPFVASFLGLSSCWLIFPVIITCTRSRLLLRVYRHGCCCCYINCVLLLVHYIYEYVHVSCSVVAALALRHRALGLNST